LDQQGATAVEYGIIVAGIAVAIAASVNQVGCEGQQQLQSRGGEHQRTVGRREPEACGPG
jgi:hypothetical protein